MTETRDLFPGVPMVESPVFDSVIETIGLNEAELRIARDLNRQGYAVFNFPDAELDARIERVRAKLAPKLTGAAGELSGRIQDAWQFDEDVRAIAANKAVLDLLSKLYGRRAFPFQTLNFPVGTEQAVHTDIVHFSSIPERFMCGVWLAMEDVQPGAGALRYYNGSHRWPVMSNTMVGRRGWGQQLDSAQTPYQQAWDALIAQHGASEEQFLARKGQALIWCANLLHGGSPRTDPALTRWSQVTHYYFDDCIYYTPAYSDEPVGRLAMRSIVDAASGEAKANLYLGEELAMSKPAAPRRSLRAKLAKAFGRDRAN